MAHKLNVEFVKIYLFYSLAVTADSPTLFVVDLRSYTPLKACGCVNGQCLLLSESCGLMAFVPSSVAVDTTQDK